MANHCGMRRLGSVRGAHVIPAVCLLPGTRRNLHNDLLVAADSITNTMSSLVKELHSGKSQLSSTHAQQENESLKPQVGDRDCLKIYSLQKLFKASWEGTGSFFQ